MIATTHATQTAAEDAARTDRTQETPPRKQRHDLAAWSPITSAAALFESGLEGEDLEEAFTALSLAEQTLYVDDLRHFLRTPVEISFP